LWHVIADDRRSVDERNRRGHQPLLVEVLHRPLGLRDISIDERDIVLPKELLRAFAKQSTGFGVDDYA
jgi:hypothetical protein